MNNSLKTLLTNPLITPGHLGRKALIYIRQSTLDQVVRNTGSQALQREQTELARAYGWPEDLIEIIDEDLAKSGSVIDRRTGWQSMLDQIATHGVGCVFSVNISRMGRQLLPIEQLRIMALYHKTLLCLDNRFTDPSNANDTVLTQITASFAQYENRIRTEHMSQARLAKARQGEVVSELPAGWIKGADGKFDYDPAVKDAIDTIIDAFMRARSLRRALKELSKAGIKVPGRRGAKLSFSNPTIANVRRILINPAYHGSYVFGRTQSQPGGPVSAKGHSYRVKVPEHLWVKISNHHPAYMTEDQQQEIKLILKNNDFSHRGRVGRGPALAQGLLRCEICNRSLIVNYRRDNSCTYACGWVFEPCTRFSNSDFEKHVLAEVFKVLKTPPLEMLKAAIQETRRQERTRLNWIESETERLAHDERRAQERVELTHTGYRRVHLDALEKLEKVLKEKEEFEQKIAALRPLSVNDESEEEVEELCRIVSDVPSLWHHEAVTHQERKEILRSVIDHIVVGATKEKINATIFWKSGGQTPLKSIWRGVARYNLIRELLAHNLTASEIRDHLAAGKTSTGQAMKLTLQGVYLILRKLGLKAPKYSVNHLLLAKKAAELYREGRSLNWTSRYFNEQGFTSTSGKPWTSNMVYALGNAIGDQPESLEKIHRRAITDARARGLNYREMADEFNETKIRRQSIGPWTQLNVAARWGYLNGRRFDRAQKGSASTELAEGIVMPRSKRYRCHGVVRFNHRRYAAQLRCRQKNNWDKPNEELVLA
jgi:DNA invertase Pin-like site-specific DNA recombinase